MNTTMSRRALLGTTALIPVAVAVASCSGLIAALPQFAIDLQTMAAALPKTLPGLAGVAGLATATVAKVQGWIGEFGALAGTIGTAVSAGGSTLVGVVSALAGSFNSIVAALGLNVPGIVSTVLQAGAALLPSILAAVGIALAPATAAPTMSAVQARGILLAMAGA